MVSMLMMAAGGFDGLQTLICVAHPTVADPNTVADNASLVTIKQAAAYCSCAVWAIRQANLVEGTAGLHDWQTIPD
jgi:hypothetical protein